MPRLWHGKGHQALCVLVLLVARLGQAHMCPMREQLEAAPETNSMSLWTLARLCLTERRAALSELRPPGHQKRWLLTHALSVRCFVDMASRTVRLVRRQVSRLQFNEVDDPLDPSHVLIIRSCIAHALHGWGPVGTFWLAWCCAVLPKAAFIPALITGSFTGWWRPLVSDIIRLVVRWGSLENSLLMVGTVHTVTDILQSPGVIMETIFIRLLLQASSG